MKIRDLEIFITENLPPGKGGRYFIFVKLVTDTNIIGYGEIYTASFSAKAMPAMIKDVFEQHILGHDPFNIESIWRNVYGRGYSARPDISLLSVLSGLEMALWDIIGKSVNKPIHALLGGRVHEKLRCYTYIYPPAPEHAHSASLTYSDPDQAAQRAVDYVKQGFTALKFDPAGSWGNFDPRMPSRERLDLSAKFCKTMRAAVGGHVDLLFGTHGQFTPAGAIRLAQRLEEYDPLWFEEPVPPESPEQMALVARATSIPIATGERLTSKYEFSRVLACHAAAILQFSLGRVGGILEAKKITAMAEAHYAQIAPHLYCGPLVGAANIQVAACSPNFLILESIEDWGGFYGELIHHGIKIKDGFALIPDGPGLGVTLNEKLAAAHPYHGDKLHLTPTEFPLLAPN